MKKYFVLFLLFYSVFSLSEGQIPTGYYNAASGKIGDTLRAALRDIIKTGHVKLSYTSSSSMDVWHAYAKTDVRSTPNNTTIWDMYSDQPGQMPAYFYTVFTSQCGTASGEGDCYSREHSMPNSWWGGLDDSNNPQYTDLHHLFPADQYVNLHKSDHPLGQVSVPTYTSTNGSKVGPCSYPGYTGIVFEPIDEYKGDFARAYFYMATRYMDQFSSWLTNYPGSEAPNVISGNNFQQWFINMLVEWNSNDPVSQKEIDRNNAIYYQTPQHNRNPFIDHPEYVCLIWNGTSCIAFPSITNVHISPANPNASSTVNILANITDNGSITFAKLYWGTTSTTLTNLKNMSITTAPTYSTTSAINAYPIGTKIYYKIVATNNTAHTTTSPIYYYEIPRPEPSNHASGLSCNSNTFYSITLSWTDAIGVNLPDAYLVKISNTGLSDIIDPVDGIPESDDIVTLNIPYGAQSCTFTGLAVSTTFYFKIFPYTNTGTNVNYKINGAIPTTSCSTSAGGGAFLCLDEGFDGGATAPFGWAFTGISSTYTSTGNYGTASPSIKLTTTGNTVYTKDVSSPAKVLLWIKGLGTDTASSLLVEGFNGLIWSNVGIVKPLPVVGTVKIFSNGLSGMSKFRFTYSKSVGSIAIDDIKIYDYTDSTAHAGPDITVCDGTSVTLNATGGVSYLWSNGALQGIPFTPHATTYFTVTVTNSDGCTATDDLIVNVNPIPITPFITQQGDTLFSNYATGNQWCNMQGAIVGATAQSYTISASGNYYLIETIDGCSSLPSNLFTAYSLHIDEAEKINSMFIIYPNPVENLIEIDAKDNNKYAVEIVDVMDRMVYKSTLSKKIIINVSNFSNGIYLVKIFTEKTTFVKWVTKN